MQVARRLYLYVIAFISLQMLLTGAANLVRLLIEVAFGTLSVAVGRDRYLRDQFSLWGAVLLVGALVWAVHWLLIERTLLADAAQADEERATIWRKLFLYGTLFVALWILVFSGSTLVSGLLAQVAATRPDLRRVVGDNAPLVAVYGVAWWYCWRIRRRDLALTPERGGGAVVARWYTYLVSYATLSLLFWSLTDVARLVWRGITASAATDLVAGDGLAVAVSTVAGLAIVSVAIWLPHWTLAQRHFAAAAPEDSERRSVLRKVYLYAVIGQTVAVTLVNLAFFCYTALRKAIGTNPLSGSGDSLLTAAGLPLVAVLVYGTFWAYHRRVLDQDSLGVAVEPERQATIRRIYTYLVALIGLALLAGGLADLLRLLLDLAFGGRATTNLSGRAWGDQISLFATLVGVGGFVWAAHWVSAQRRALAAAGAAERHALIRRIYTFLVLFASVVALLVSGAILLYRLLRSLGIGLSGDDRSDLSWALAATITAAVTLAYHVRVLLDDQRARAGQPEPAPPGAPERAATASLVLVTATDAERGGVLGELRRHLPTGTVVSFPAPGLTAQEVAEWLASRGRASDSMAPGAQAGPPPAEAPSPAGGT